MAGVGRRRKGDTHLPRRVYQRHGAYFYVDSAGRWQLLAREYAAAIAAYARLLQVEEGETIAALIDRFEREEIGRLAPKTRQVRKQEFKRLRQVFGRQKIADLEPHDVWNFWRSEGERPQTRHQVAALSMLMTFARRIGLLSKSNPCFGLQLPKAAPRRRHVTDEEYLLVRSVAPPMIKHAMYFAARCGMDGATIRSLERRNITEEGLLFERPKTGRLQLIRWDEDAELRGVIDALKALRPQLRQVLICNRGGKAYTLDGFQNQWQRTMRNAVKAGLAERFHFHDLRAKAGTESANLLEAADRLGHMDPA
ncbi:MAG: hypothetical protein ACRD3Q_17425, partial [Terriglobales bacterium]